MNRILLSCPMVLLAGVISVMPGWSACYCGAQEATDPIALSGFSESQTYEVDDRSVLSIENSFLARLLYRARRASETSFRKYRLLGAPPTREELFENPRAFRFRVLEVKGTLVRWEAIRREPGGEGELVYRTEWDTADGNAIVFFNEIPAAWSQGDSVTEECRCDAFFLKLDPGVDASVPVFVGNRLEWYPETPVPEFGISADHVVLSAAGVDATVIHSMRQRNARQITEDDSRGFYQLLGAANRLSMDAFDGNHAGFEDLLRDARDHVGEAASLRGYVRRCIEVKVNDLETQQWLGTDRYFEIDMFYDLAGRRIVINSAEGPLSYEDRFPVTLCVTELPSGTTPDELEKKILEVGGVFFRLWRYSAEKTKNEPQQIAPLIVGLDVQVVDLSARPLDLWLTVGGVAVFLGLAGLLGFNYWSDRGRGRRAKDALPEKLELP